MRILVSAFDPYDVWERNSSWEALVAWLSKGGGNPQVVTRKYPVDLVGLQSRLERDLGQGIQAVLHFGQAPGIAQIQLESIALNIAGITDVPDEEYGPILTNAPLAYRTRLPVGRWSRDLKQAAIPSSVSYHAGTYLCNAAMFLSHHWFASRQEVPLVGFVHLPLLPEQVVRAGRTLPSMPLEQSAKALEMLVERVIEFCDDREKSGSGSPQTTQTA
jgi:pyroglutamyl-peptidase